MSRRARASRRDGERSEIGSEATARRGWPGWAKAGASAALVFHILAVLAAALAASPSSMLELRAAALFRPYHQLIDQGASYRYYIAGAPPTPIVTAELVYDDGRVERLRIPDRSMRPRLRYQRHLALAYHLNEDVRRAPRGPDGRSLSRWAESYARHLCRTHPGCRQVTLYLTDHRNPTPRELVEAAQEGRRLDVESDRYYTPPRRIGAYLCDD